MIFRSQKKLELGILKLGTNDYCGLHLSDEHSDYKGDVLVIRESNREEYIEDCKAEGRWCEGSLVHENWFPFYYEVHID